MEREVWEENYRQLSAEITEWGEVQAGFPERVLADLRREMEQRKGGDIMLFYDTEVEGRPVKGSLYFERESAGGPFRWVHFEVDLGKDSGTMVKENSFVRGSGYAVNLREAVNLMEGRSIYREPAFDPARQGYWVSLSANGPFAGMHLLEYDRNDFVVEPAIRESPLAWWLDRAAQEKLSGELREGKRVRLEVGPSARKRVIFVEVDALEQRLRFTDSRQREVELPGPSPTLTREHHSLGQQAGRKR
jgi:hypothetical protein